MLALFAVMYSSACCSRTDSLQRRPIASGRFVVAENETLSEATALRCSRELLKQASMNPMEWTAVEDDRATGQDRYMYRNTIQPNRGLILFSSSTGVRILALAYLCQDHLICELYYPK